MGARSSRNVWGTQITTKHRTTAAGKGSQGLGSGSGNLQVWADAFAESLMDETAVKYPKRSIGLKLKNILRFSSQERQEVVLPAPYVERGKNGRTTPANPVPPAVAGDGSAQATTEVPKDKKDPAGSINTFGSTRSPVEVPKRSSSLGKCSLERPKLDSTLVGNSAYAARPLTEPPHTEPVVNLPFEELSIRHQISALRARAKITSGTFTCASPAALSVSPIGNPYLPYGMGREPGISPYSTIFTNTTNTAEDSAVTTATGSENCSSASISLGKVSPLKELEQNQANGDSSKALIDPRDRAGYLYTSFQGIPDPDSSVTERYKQRQHHKHRQKYMPKRKASKGKGKAKATSPDLAGLGVNGKTQNHGTSVDKDDGHTSTSRQSTPSERRRQSSRRSSKRSKARRVACPPEIFCALVWLDGQVPYSTDSEEVEEDKMKPWERELQAELRLGGKARKAARKVYVLGRSWTRNWL
ncbi:hypothetical protein L211DRAFT_850654 [Terfezia boudieri ATCC MYA-4762]|uniref:Uncharacterized protein n=1 Tax=Terfezia boudieri ATCC MYA-4762 TaxID=1051890 RepID=A0A3N4LLJ1_9PEZI|nr:hypothetical protein L211DRAFT_850654 [Terfezia boudieri ATCC MYA-4762]